MILNMILGFNIDTKMFIEELKKNEVENIVILDYDHFDEAYQIDKVLYLSKFDAKEYIKKFDSVNFYKSLYGWPGSAGNRSRFYKN